MILAKHRPKLEDLKVASLEGSPLMLAGEPGDIRSACPSIQELDIGFSHLEDF
jgi:hypothetical protein